MNPNTIHVLLVEDNVGDARLIIEALADVDTLEIKVRHVDSLSQALAALAEAPVDVILLDLSLPDAQGENTADQMYAAVPDIPIVIITGLNDEDFAIRLISKRAQDYLVKGRLDGLSLVRSIRYAIERKRTLVALSASETRYRDIVETTHEWMWTVDRDRRFKYSNPAVKTMLGYDPLELIDEDMTLRIHPDDLPQFEAFWTDHIASALAWNTLLVRCRHKDNTYRYLEINAVPMFNLSGEIIGYRGANRDITERKQLEAQKTSMEVERERAQLFKRFIGGVSHDLRTPLSIMNTSLDLLRRITQSERQLHHLETLEEQTHHIQTIVEDLFMLSRLEIESAKMCLDPLNLNALIEAACAEQHPLATKKNHRIILNLDANLPEVRGDWSELKHAFKHLLVNALNYTPDSGEIRLSTSRQDQFALFTITDSGIGIPADEMPLIFERFYRADEARSSETGGSGLGLTITKKIIETLGGSIRVESTPGHGSTFYVTLPLVVQEVG